MMYVYICVSSRAFVDRPTHTEPHHTTTHTHTPSFPFPPLPYVQTVRDAQGAALALLERLDGRCRAFREQIRASMFYFFVNASSR